MLFEPKISASGQTCGQVRKMGLFNPESREEQAHYVYCESEGLRENKRKSEVRLNLRFWSEWQDLNLRPLPPQATKYSFLRDIASNTCFLVRKDWYKVRRVLLSPGSPVLKVVKHVVVKSAPIWCGQASRERITFYRSIVVRSCGRLLTDSAHPRLSYCNSFERVCQEVSRMKFWDAVIKEKGRSKHMAI